MMEETVKIEGFILSELTKIRDDLFESLPSGEINSFQLINAIKNHIKNLDSIIDYYSKVEKDMKTERGR